MNVIIFNNFTMGTTPTPTSSVNPTHIFISHQPLITAPVALTAGGGAGHRLDKCAVTVYPPLNPEHEALSVNQRLLDSLQLRAKLNKDGLVVHGPGQPDSYQQVGHRTDCGQSVRTGVINRRAHGVLVSVEGAI